MEEQIGRLSTLSMNMTEDPLVLVYILGIILNNATTMICETEILQVINIYTIVYLIKGQLINEKIFVYEMNKGP